MKPFKISIDGFRGFYHQPAVPVRPITLLVGENSAGKTSFLAAVKYLVDFISRVDEPSFNKDPFQLGTFQQIAHVRGGRGGRVPQVSFSVEIQAERQAFGRRPRTRPVPSAVQYRVVFTAFESQASVSELRISQAHDTLIARLTGDSAKFEVLNGEGNTLPIPEIETGRIARLDFNRYIPFLIQDIAFRASRERTSPDGPHSETDRALDLATRLAEYGLGVSAAMSGAVEATSAIRTKPHRTYTPGVETQDSEGTHVPFELAKLDTRINLAALARP